MPQFGAVLNRSADLRVAVEEIVEMLAAQGEQDGGLQGGHRRGGGDVGQQRHLAEIAVGQGGDPRRSPSVHRHVHRDLAPDEDEEFFTGLALNDDLLAFGHMLGGNRSTIFARSDRSNP